MCGSPAYLFYSTNTTISPLYDHVENIQKKRSNQMYVGVVPTNRPFYSSSLSLLFLFCTLPGRELGWIDMMCGFFFVIVLFICSFYLQIKGSIFIMKRKIFFALLLLQFYGIPVWVMSLIQDVNIKFIRWSKCLNYLLIVFDSKYI